MKTSKDLIEYDITIAAIEEMKQKYSGMKITDAKSDKAVRAARTFVVSKRTAVEKRRVELNAEANEHRRKVNEKAKEITALLLPIEEPLQAECKRVDDEKARIKAEKEEAERQRIETIQARINSIRELGIVNNMASAHIEERLIIVQGMMVTQEVYQEFTIQAEDALNSAIIALQEALSQRLQFEKEEEERKAEAERLEAQRKEQEAAQAKIDAANRKLEEEKAKIAAEKYEQEVKENFMEEMKKKAEREERERLEREEAEAKEKARQAAMAPDKDKLIRWIDSFTFNSIPPPMLNSKEAKEIYRIALEQIEMILQDAMEKAEQL